MKILIARVIFFTFLIFPLFLFGQKKKLAEGFIVTTQRDTLYCSFKDRNWKKQPYEFAVLINNKDSILYPGKIEEVNIGSKDLIYVSRAVKPAKYIDNVQNANKNEYPDFDSTRFVFVRMLHAGALSLYFFSDKLGYKHFFVENRDNFIEMYLHLYTGIGGPLGNQAITIENRQYEFILKTLMTPCRTIFSIIENIRLEEDQLIQLFKMYDRCIESKKEN
jgi:hypothetical protein